MTDAVMLQGTASDAGKSVLAAGLCRIFKQDGLAVVPFKSQNMALNSFITSLGDEMGRAQVTQAEAAGLEPDVRMNPVLLKPSSDHRSQVIFLGKILGEMDATSYHQFKPALLEDILQIYQELGEEYDAIVVEGAGSPAEINLKDKDIVNMGLARAVGCPVILVADIDKGGVFASIYGTIALLEPEERALVKGIIINKFRGDVALLQPGIDMIEELTGVPVLGVVPYLQVAIDPEDSVALSQKSRTVDKTKDLDIAVIGLKRLSNFTDFQALENEVDVSLRYVWSATELGTPDVIILPGSKDTIGDCLYLQEEGIDQAISRAVHTGSRLFGICGGYQLLGRRLLDPDGVESQLGEIAGLGFLDIETVFRKSKRTKQVQARQGSYCLSGYEIHMGETKILGQEEAFAVIEDEGGRHLDGAVSRDGHIQGTYLHGIFANQEWTRAYLNQIRSEKGLAPLPISGLSMAERKEQAYNQLADQLRSSLDMKRIYQILKGEGG